MHLTHLYQFEFKIYFKQTAESMIWSALFSYVPQKGHRVYMDRKRHCLGWQTHAVYSTCFLKLQEILLDRVWQNRSGQGFVPRKASNTGHRPAYVAAICGDAENQVCIYMNEMHAQTRTRQSIELSLLQQDDCQTSMALHNQTGIKLTPTHPKLVR